MHLLVVDPRLLVRAFEHPHGRPAKLLSLLAYGQVCLDAAGQHLEEYEEIEATYRGIVDDDEIADVRARAQREHEIAVERKALMQDACEQYPPSDLLLVTSPPLRSELIELARVSQRQGHRHVVPHVANRQIALVTAKSLPPPPLGAAPFYLGAGRVSEREYLIHTGVIAEAESLVTEDPDLLLPGDARHSDPRTRRSVRPYTLDDFAADVLHHGFNLDEVDAARVLREAVRPLGRV